VALAAKGYDVRQGTIGDAAVAAAALEGAEVGVLATAADGRPTAAEGRPQNPISPLLSRVPCQVVFLVTQFWESFSAEAEFNEGKAFIDAVHAASQAAVAAGKAPIKLVFSTLENVTRVTEGRITRVAHFDGKGRIAEYAKTLPGLSMVCTMLAAYLENFLTFFTPRPGPDGTLAITLPDMGGKPCNFVSVEETGHFVAAILRNWSTYEGRDIPLVSELAPTGDVIAAISDEVGIKVVFNPVPYEVFATFPFPAAEDLAEMFRYYADGPIDRDPTTALALFPGASNAKAWAAAHKDAIRAAWSK